MDPESTGNLPKYACKEYGSDEVRSEFNGYDVFLAEGDKLILIRSEGMEDGVFGLCCLSCNMAIEVDDFAELSIE